MRHKGTLRRHQLAYAVSPNHTRPFRIVRLCACLAATVAGLCLGGRYITSRASGVRAYAQVANRRELERVVYDSDPTGVNALLRQPGYFCKAVYDNQTAAVSSLIRANELTAVAPSCRLTSSEVPLFIRERLSSRGRRKLVIVVCDTLADPSDSLLNCLRVIICDPVTFFSDPREPREVTHPLGYGGLVVDDRGIARITVFAGQVNDIDNSCFSIMYRLNGGTRIIYGSLRDDGEDVVLTELPKESEGWRRRDGR